MIVGEGLVGAQPHLRLPGRDAGTDPAHVDQLTGDLGPDPAARRGRRGVRMVGVLVRDYEVEVSVQEMGGVMVSDHGEENTRRKGMERNRREGGRCMIEVKETKEGFERRYYEGCL